MNTKDFFKFKTVLAGSFLPLIKDSTPLKGKKEVMEVHWLKIREIKCEPGVDKIHIDFRYNVSSAFQSVAIGSTPRKTRKSGQELFNLPDLYEEKLSLSEALLKVSLKFLIP